MIIWIPVFWTKYTATRRGSLVKVVPCENCSTEYVYLLERESSGVGTSVYYLNEDGAAGHAEEAAKDTLQSVLDNDFDPVPCPACGHYQRFMFPKLSETKGTWISVVMFVLLLFGCFDAVSALYWSVSYLNHPNEYALDKLVARCSLLLLLGLIGLALSVIKQVKIRRFDPNLEDQQARIAKGRSRAMTRKEFEMAQRGETTSEAGA